MNTTNIDNLYDLTTTYQYSKYSCMKGMYPVHIAFSYLVFFSGIFCFITRLHPKMHYAHKWLGRIYILSMLYATASSLLINNTGLPLGVLISFVYTMVGLGIGWILIVVHQEWMNDKALKNLEESVDKITKDRIVEEKSKINRDLTIVQRVFSYKTFHGVLMLLSWINIAGRVFVTNPDIDFTCYTYAVYKFGVYNQSNNTLTLVPQENPNYDRLPWANNEGGWATYLLVGPVLFGLLVSVIWATGYKAWKDGACKT